MWFGVTYFSLFLVADLARGAFQGVLGVGEGGLLDLFAAVIKTSALGSPVVIISRQPKLLQ